RWASGTGTSTRPPTSRSSRPSPVRRARAREDLRTRGRGAVRARWPACDLVLEPTAVRGYRRRRPPAVRAVPHGPDRPVVRFRGVLPDLRLDPGPGPRGVGRSRGVPLVPDGAARSRGHAAAGRVVPGPALAGGRVLRSTRPP